MPRPPQPSRLVERLVPPEPGRPSSQQDILSELRRVILAGGAPPGTPIPLEAVARLFVVSAIPVRESLKTLIGEGLVDHEPRGGYRVAELTRDELREFYVIREVLEAAALRSAVR
ncbi:MAG: GntR family transcriptional regulator, partial [Nocardioidaceae bacterium]